MFGSSASSMSSSSVGTGTNEKKSLRRIEIALNKFNEVAVPYHVDLLRKHKSNIERFEQLGQLSAAHREHINAGRAVQQLKALLYEVDGLRAQVRDDDLEEFAKITAKARQSVQDAIQSYLDMQKPDVTRVLPSCEWPSENDGMLDDAPLPPLQLQLDPEAEEAELAKREAYLKSWEHLHTEFEDLHQLFQDFAAVVQSQGELVTQVETHVENAQQNVTEGNRILAKASHFKAASYPMFGALLGGCVGGPVGLLAGLKLGGLAAIGGGLLGFTSGKFLKNRQIEPVPEEIEETEEKSEADVAVQPVNPVSTSCLTMIT